jgi:glycosyltransferase involved in cell wall biosynthesis
LPVYNAEDYLAETLSSLLCQTHKDFEVIAINDGSTDRSLEILKKYSDFDDRILVIDQGNAGLVTTLNRAAEIASGEFLARIDADDIALPRRFQLQVEEFLKHPDCVLIGSQFDVINNDGELLYHDAVPTNSIDVINAMLIRNPIAHGSIMMRKETFIQSGGYSPHCGPTEDYELWSRLLSHGSVRILQPTLFRWRVNPTGITSTKSKIIEQFMKENIDKFWKEHPFKLQPRHTLIRKTRHYMQNNPIHGVSTKYALLRDLADISIELIKRGRPMDGARQLLIIASTGRTGLRIVRHRLTAPIKYHSKAMSARIGTFR